MGFKQEERKISLGVWKRMVTKLQRVFGSNRNKKKHRDFFWKQ